MILIKYKVLRFLFLNIDRDIDCKLCLVNYLSVSRYKIKLHNTFFYKKWPNSYTSFECRKLFGLFKLCSNL